MDLSCGQCKFHVAQAGFGVCWRYPQHITVDTSHWCGEYVQLPTQQKDREFSRPTLAPIKREKR